MALFHYSVLNSNHVLLSPINLYGNLVAFKSISIWEIRMRHANVKYFWISRFFKEKSRKAKIVLFSNMVFKNNFVERSINRGFK